MPFTLAELQFRPTDDVFELARKFPRYVQKYLHSSQQTCSWRLYYKREACVSLARERKIKDPVSVRLLYFECAFNVLDSRYPIKEDDLFALAGMRMQILHGDYRADIHKIGFLTQPTNERLLDLIPSQMVQRATPTVGISFGVQRAPRFNDWEDRIYREHAKHKGKPRMIMHLLYLQLVRTYAFYGSTFFSACTQEPPQGHFEYRDRTLQLGVNAEGVYVIDPAKAAVLASHNYDDINWDVQQDSLVLEYGPTNAPLMMVLISPQARMAASIIAHAIKLLDERDAQYEKREGLLRNKGADISGVLGKMRFAQSRRRRGQRRRRRGRRRLSPWRISEDDVEELSCIYRM